MDSREEARGGEAKRGEEAGPNRAGDRSRQNGAGAGGKENGAGLNRRQFLRRAGLGAGALAAGGSLGGTLASCAHTPAPGAGRSPDVVVVGAGAFGGWTAFHLQRMGARVTLVDLYGPGNARSTSGDETRGIRTSYGDRELWVDWANQSIERWRAFDEEWGRELGVQLFHSAGDLILRPGMDDRIEASRRTWDRLGVPYEILEPDEIAYRWPHFNLENYGVGLYEPNAGVGKSRLACLTVAEAFRREGGRIRIGRATPGAGAGGTLHEVDLGSEGTLGGELFVFALGPWFPKAFPELWDDKLRLTMGQVVYFGTPPGDTRFLHPNMPSFGVPGTTGWPPLPPDHYGLRIRTAGRGEISRDPDGSERWFSEDFLPHARAILEENFPDMADQPIVKTHACHYESSPDREWIIDTHPEWDNVWFMGAGNAEGFKFGPKLGEYMAARALGDDPYPELAARLRRVKDETATEGAGA